MPELPEVEHVVRALRRAVVGRRIVETEIRLPKLISPLSSSAFSRKLKGSTIRAVARRGKFILIELEPNVALPHGRASDTSGGLACQKPDREGGLVLVVHLRMTGKFLYQS